MTKLVGIFDYFLFKDLFYEKGYSKCYRFNGQLSPSGKKIDNLSGQISSFN